MAEENERKAERTQRSAPGEGAPVLGKFADVDALVRAYGELEAEFTRRSQRLKELEKRSKEALTPSGEILTPNGENGRPSERAQCESADNGHGRACLQGEGGQNGTDNEALYRSVVENEGVRSRIVSEYLSSLRGVPLMTGAGTGVTAPAHKPRSIAEAGELALGYLKSKK